MLQINKLQLARGAKSILRDASATIYPKEKVGLIGHNGAGKSSLLSALLGHLLPDAGEIDIPRSWKVAAIEQELTDQDQTVMDFVLAGDSDLLKIQRKIDQAQLNDDHEHLGQYYAEMDAIDGYTAQSRAGSILHGLGFKQADLQRKVREFSGGWQMRMNLARVLGSRADLLLLDEPTNHLDIDAVIWLQQWIKQVEATVVVVSHDRDFLDSICTHIIHLNSQQLTKYTGGYSAFELAFAEKMEQIEAANQKAATEKAHLQKFIDRFKAKATKAKQAQSRVKRLEKIQMIEQLSVDRSANLSFPEPAKSPDPLVVLNKANCGYGEHAIILNGITMEIRPGDRIGLLGANGNGKTTLVKSLVGQLGLQGGSRVEGKGLVPGYFAQNEIDSLDWDATPMEHMVRLDPKATEQYLRGFLAQYHFTDDKIFQKVGSFSGGEKSRLALAIIAYKKPNLLLLDEPTNHLDISSRQSLATGLLEYAGALVVVSHDRHLLESITDKYIWVHDGKAMPFEGDLDDYSVALKLANTVSGQDAAGEVSSVPSALQQSKADRQAAHQRLKQVRNQIKKLEAQPEILSKKISELDTLISQISYDVPSAAARAHELSKSREDEANKLAAIEEELLELMMELDELEAGQA